MDLEVGDYLDPEKSRQNQKVICATSSIEKSIIHTSEGKDEQLQVFGDSDGFFERYQGAFLEAFNKKKRFVYYISREGAQRGQFSSESLFFEKKQILKKEIIDCAYTCIKKFCDNGELEFNEYPLAPSDFMGSFKKDNEINNNLDLLIGRCIELVEGNLSFKNLKEIFEVEIKKMEPSLVALAFELSNYDLNYKDAVKKLQESINPPPYSEENWNYLKSFSS